MRKQMQYWLGPRRPWLWILLALLLYTLGGFIVAPWLVERQMVNISAERAGLNTSIDNIDINPLTLTLTMEGLDVTDRENEPLLSLERLFVNFELGSLWHRAWTFDQFHADALHVAVERFSDGDTNIGTVAERWTAAEQAPEPQEEDSGGPVRLVIADLQVNSSTLSLVDHVPEERFETRVEAFDLVIRNLSTLPDDTAGQNLTLTMDNGAVLSWDGTSSLYPLHSQGRITLQGAYPQLVYEYFQDRLPFDINGSELDAEFEYRVGTDAEGMLSADITDAGLALLDIVISDRDSGAQLLSLPELSVENGELHWPANTVHVENIHLRGTELYPVREQDGTLNFVSVIEAFPVEGEPVASEADAGEANEASPWRLSVAELALEDWEVNFNDQVPDQPAMIELGLDATITDISTVPDAVMQLESSIDVTSGGMVSLSGTVVALPQFQLDSELALEDLALGVLQPYITPFANLAIDQGRLGLDGSVTASLDSQSYRGDASVSELSLTDTVEDELLLSVDTLQINSIALQNGEEASLEVDEVRILSPYANVVIEQDRSTNIGRVMVTSEADDNAPTARAGEEDAADQPMAVLVDSIVLDSARVDFEDKSLPLPFSVSIDTLEGNVSALSTRSQQPATIDFEGQVGEFGAVTVAGELRPLAYAENTQVQLLFNNINMPTLSPYVAEFAGREIDGGRLDADLSYRIEDEQLNGSNELVMRDLQLGETVPNPDAMDVPLGLAVALLQDGDGVINLDIPVSGDVGSPEFDIAEVIGDAATGILRNIVTSPFRFLSGLFGSDDDEDMAVVGFPPGSSDVAPPERQQLRDLAGALEQRPQLQLQVPAVYATQADTEALAQRLLTQSVEERMSGPLEPEQEEMSASTRRVLVLEEMMLSQGLAVEQGGAEDTSGADPSETADGPVSLAMLRLGHLMPAQENEEARLDEPAYANTLRTRLLAEQSVPPGELEALARQRAEQVLTIISDARPALGTRVDLMEVAETTLNENGQVTMALELGIDG